MLVLLSLRVVEGGGEATATVTMGTGDGHTMATVEPVGEEGVEEVLAVTGKIPVVVGVAISLAQDFQMLLAVPEKRVWLMFRRLVRSGRRGGEGGVAAADCDGCDITYLVKYGVVIAL